MTLLIIFTNILERRVADDWYKAYHTIEFKDSKITCKKKQKNIYIYFI